MLLKLVQGEQVIVRTRAHHRALLPMVVNLLVTVGLMSFLLGYVSRDTQPTFVQHYSHIFVFIIWALGLLSLAFGTVKPGLGWLNRVTYLSTERVVQKNMIGAGQATVIPLALLTQTEVRQTKLQQMSGAGTIALVHGAFGQHQRTRLRDMPDAERFNDLIAQELSSHRRRAQAQQAAHARRAAPASPQPGQPAPDPTRGDVAGSSFGGDYGVF